MDVVGAHDLQRAPPVVRQCAPLVEAPHGDLRGALLEQVEQEVAEGGDDDLDIGTQTRELRDDAVNETQTRLLAGPVGLDLDIGVEAGVVHEVDEIAQGGKRLTREPRGEPASGVDVRQIGRRQIVVPTGAIRGPVQGGVMADDDRSVGDDVDVGLDPRHPMIHRTTESGHGVLRGQRAQAPVPEDSCARRRTRAHHCLRSPMTWPECYMSRTSALRGTVL